MSEIRTIELGGEAGTIRIKDLVLACSEYAKNNNIEKPLSLMNKKEYPGLSNFLCRKFKISNNKISSVVLMLNEIFKELLSKNPNLYNNIFKLKY